MKRSDRIKEALSRKIDLEAIPLNAFSELDGVLFKVRFDKRTGEVTRVFMSPDSETEYGKEQKR